jgi:hypothetical protein
MSDAAKPQRRAGPRRKPCVTPQPTAASSQARRQAAAILEVLAGVLRPAEAAQAIQTSLARYYVLERRALAGLLAACEPSPRGPRIDLGREMATLERENQRLRRECDRQQALVRAAERALGVARLSLVNSPAKRKEEAAGSQGKPRRRLRRPTVRALKAARSLQSQTAASVPEEIADAVEATAVTAVE